MLLHQVCFKIFLSVEFYCVSRDMDRFDFMNTTVPAIKEEQLEILSTVRMVTQYVEISLFDYSPTNLSFLRNLETIVGRKQR